MIEVNNILGPCATLSSVAIAIFVFTLPKALSSYNEKNTSLSGIDIPDSVEKQKFFNVFIFQGSIFLFVLSFVSLLTGFLFITALWASLILNSANSLFTESGVISYFTDLVWWLGIVILVLAVISATLFGSEAIIGKKKLSLLARIYVNNVLNQKSTGSETEKMIPEAKLYYEKGAYGESILYSAMSLENALKTKYNLPLNLNFRRVVVELKDKLGKIVPVEELNSVRRIRNKAAHPGQDNIVTKEDAEMVLNTVENLLKRLDQDDENC
jgi:hypothetical protein